MIFMCWKTGVELLWNLTRKTFTFLVDKVLMGDMSSVREGVFTVRRSEYWQASQPVMVGA